MAAHRYWRLWITAFNTVPAGGGSFAEIQLRDTKGGPDLTGSGTASASSYYDSNWVPANAVDNNEATGWHIANQAVIPQWWKYDFGAGNAYDIIQILITAEIGWRTVKDFVVQYSDDDSVYTPYFSYGGATGWADHETRTFNQDDPPAPAKAAQLFGQTLIEQTDGYTNAAQLFGQTLIEQTVGYTDAAQLFGQALIEQPIGYTNAAQVFGQVLSEPTTGGTALAAQFYGQVLTECLPSAPGPFTLPLGGEFYDSVDYAHGDATDPINGDIQYEIRRWNGVVETVVRALQPLTSGSLDTLAWPEGSYTLRAYAYNGEFSTTFAESLPFEIIIPLPSAPGPFTLPSSGTFYESVAYVHGSATDPLAQPLEYEIRSWDGVSENVVRALQADTFGPVDTAAWPQGTYTLRAYAHSVAGYSATAAESVSFQIVPVPTAVGEDQYTLAPAGDYTDFPLAVVVMTVAKATAGANVAVEHSVEVGGNKVFGAAQVASGTYGTQNTAFQTKPGGAAWSAADIEELRSGFKQATLTP